MWPVDTKGEPLKATSYMAVSFYVAKCVNKKSDMDLAAKGLGAKEWIDSLKTKLSLLTKKLFRISIFFQAENGILDLTVTGVQTCALPISSEDLEAASEELAVAEAGLDEAAATLEAVPTEAVPTEGGATAGAEEYDVVAVAVVEDEVVPDEVAEEEAAPATFVVVEDAEPAAAEPAAEEGPVAALA